MMTPKYEITLAVKGIFGRNRTSKFNCFTIKTSLDEKPSVEEASKLCAEKLEAVKLKHGVAVGKIERYEEETSEIDGVKFLSRTFVLRQEDKQTVFSDERRVTQ